MKKIAIPLIFLLLSGCATSAQERRMRDANESTTESSVARNIGIGIAVLAVAAAASSAKSGGYTPATVADYDWAWDLQRGSNGTLVWVCRGIQSGQYSEQARCTYKLKADSQWPGY